MTGLSTVLPAGPLSSGKARPACLPRAPRINNRSAEGIDRIFQAPSSPSCFPFSCLRAALPPGFIFPSRICRFLFSPAQAQTPCGLLRRSPRALFLQGKGTGVLRPGAVSLPLLSPLRNKLAAIPGKNLVKQALCRRAAKGCRQFCCQPRWTGGRRACPPGPEKDELFPV